LRSPTVSRTPTLTNVPEENAAFAIGDDDDSDADEATPQGTPQSPSAASRSASIASSVDESVPLQLRGMSEKARGKRPVGQPAFSRQNSTASLSSLATPSLAASEFFTPSATWVSSMFHLSTTTTLTCSQIEGWLPELPLHTILMLISEITPKLSSTGDSSTDTSKALRMIRDTEVRGIEPSSIRVHSFEWSPLSLGWYESLLWGFVFAGEMTVSKGTAGVWNNTSIRLFKVQEAAAQTPSLLAPRGAVDAVGSNLVQRIGNLNLRGTGNQGGQRGVSGAGGGNTASGPGTVRDV